MGYIYLLGYPRGGTTYLRFILSYLLKTYAGQPDHNNDPIFSDFPKDTTNSLSKNFIKFHFSDEIKEHHLNNKNIKYIFIVLNPIDAIKAYQIYKKKHNQNFNAQIENSIEWSQYWKNIEFIDNIKPCIFISFKDLINEEKHYNVINDICTFLSISIGDYNKDVIYNNYNERCNKYRYNSSKQADYFDRSVLRDKIMEKLVNIKNIELKNMILNEL